MASGYLDTVLIIGLADNDLPANEQDALTDLLARRKRGEIALFTSVVAREELDRHRSLEHRIHDVIYDLIDDVPTVTEQLPRAVTATAPVGSRAISPPVDDDRMLVELRQILPGDDDARHVFQAARNALDYFITCDHHTILRFAAEGTGGCGNSTSAPESGAR
jgi:hypothetical protein